MLIISGYSTYFLVTTESMISSKKISLIKNEIEASAKNISQFIKERESHISLLSQLSLVKVSIEFDRPEKMQKFLEDFKSKNQFYQDILILKKSNELFIGEQDLLNAKLSDGIKSDGQVFITSDNTVYIKSSVMLDNNEIGKVVGIVPSKVILNVIDHLSRSEYLPSNAMVKLTKGEEDNKAGMFKFCSPINFQQLNLCFTVPESELNKEFNRLIILLLITFFIVIIVYYFIINKFIDQIVNNFNGLLKKFELMLQGKQETKAYHSKFNEFESMNNLLNQTFIRLKEYQDIENEKFKLKVTEKLNRQIAHDIRSPLEALSSITGSLENVDHSTKQIIINSTARISDIASGLLKETGSRNNEKLAINLRMLLDDLIKDKNFEHQINIYYQVETSYRESFIMAKSSDIYRALSNLLNNSVEAKAESELAISLKLELENGKFKLTIIDNGIGMSDELLDKAIKGAVTTKPNGNGLGLSFAKSALEENQATFEISSIPNQGTTVSISFDRASTPSWFTDELSIPSTCQKVVCIDDDASFLELYKEKFKDYSVEVYSEKQISQVEFNKNDRYFIDFDLGIKTNGLMLIESKGLMKSATLVTSMHQDIEIQNKCMELAIKLLPKQIFNHVAASKSLNQTSQSIVLIDDDPLVHMVWKVEAKKKNIDFKAFTSINEFLNNCDTIDKDSSIYIDSNLGDDIKGEIESEEVYKRGYHHLYLATGHTPEEIECPSWIKEICGKKPPF